MCPEIHNCVRLLVADDLPEEARRRAREHLETCSACRERLASLRATWEALQHWDVHPAAPEAFMQRVMRAAAADRAAQLSRQDWFGYSRRVAAALILSAGAGAAAALLIPAAAPEVAATQPTTAEQVALSLGLDALSGESASLFAHLYDVDQQVGEKPEEQS